MDNYKTQAQIELFVDSKYFEGDKEDKDNSLRNARSLSQTSDFSSLTSGSSKNLVNLVDSCRGNPGDFIKDIDPEQIKEVADNSIFYEQKFKQKVQELKGQINGSEAEAIPGYLGKGSNGYAFEVEVDEKSYAVKLPHFGGMDGRELEWLRKGKNIDKLSQLVAYSFEDAAIVMNLLPGRNAVDFDTNTRPQYKDAELEKIVETVDKMHMRGIVPDPKASNFMYDSEAGLSILDYVAKGDSSLTATSIIQLSYALSYASDVQFRHHIEDIDENENSRLGYDKVFQETKMSARLLHTMKDKFPHIFAEALERNAELKADSRSSTFKKGYFDKQDILGYAEYYAKDLPDSEQRIRDVKLEVLDIEGMGFF